MSAASTFTTYGLDSNAFKLGFSLQRVLEWLETMDQDIDVKEWAYPEKLRPLEEENRTLKHPMRTHTSIHLRERRRRRGSLKHSKRMHNLIQFKGAYTWCI